MVGCDQLCLLPNQITESFDHFDYQYLWKESIDILTFCIEIVIKGRQHVRLAFPVKWGQVGFLSNLSAQFSDHQYLWKESIDLLNLLIFFAWRWSSREGSIWDYTLVGCGHTCLLSNEITEFLYHQYLWNELSDISDFFQGDNHQEKGVSETATFGWVCQGVLLIQSDCRILWSLIFFEGIIWYPIFLAFR